MARSAKMKRKPIPFRKWLTRWKKAGSPVFPESNHIKLVLWTDAAGSTDEDTITPVKTLVVGFLMEATTEYIKLAMEVFEDGSAREYLVIPSKMILNVFDVARAEM